MAGKRDSQGPSFPALAKLLRKRASAFATNKVSDRSSFMATHISTSPEQTIALGRAFGERARPGMIVGLKGDLGAGKTQFVRGVATGLGATDRVHSPTFALINEYLTGRLPVFHIDLYRLETAEAILSAG